jgi:hypothetical protein
MNRLFFLLSLIISSIISNAQINNADSLIANNLKDAAQKMGNLFIAKDYNNYVKYIHPNILNAIGGKEKMATLLKTSLADMEKQGYTFKGVTIGQAISIIHFDKQLQSIIPQLLEIKTSEGRLIATSYLLAISNDDGKTWYFADTSGKPINEIKAIIPHLSDQLIVPAKTQPVFYKD